MMIFFGHIDVTHLDFYFLLN